MNQSGSDHPGGFGDPSGDPSRPEFARPAFPVPNHPGPGHPGPNHPGPGHPGPAQPGPQPTGPSPARRSHRRRRTPLVLLSVALIVLTVLVVGDRLAVRATERQLAGTLQTQLGTPEQPEVEVRGVPFLTQLVTRRFGDITVRAANVPAEGNGVALESLQADLHDVRPTSGQKSIQIAQLDGTAAVSYPALSASVKQTIEYGGKSATGVERVKVDLDTTIVGQVVRASVVGELALDATAQSLTLLDPEVTVLGQTLPAEVAKQLVASFVPPIKVSGLPLGVRLSSIEAGSKGIDVGLTGSNLTITGR